MQMSISKQKIDRTEILLGIVNYNQANEITPFLNEILKYWPKDQIVLVDDGSTDRSLQTAEDLNLYIVRHKENKGVGAAIRSILLEARNRKSKAILIMSSNGKMLPSEIYRLVEPIINGEADYVTGSRFLSGGSFPGLSHFRKWSIPVLSLAYSFLYGRRFSDITCGFRCYKCDWLFDDSIDIFQPWLNKYEMEYYIHYWACKKNLRITEVPVTIKYDHLKKNRKSKIRPVIDWWSIFRPVLYLKLGIKK